MEQHNSLTTDLAQVFIPCRTVLEMETLVSLYLANSNYYKIQDLPSTQPTSEQLISALEIQNNPALERIVDFFINVAVEKLKPVTMYARDHHDTLRMGNVVPYTKSRVCLFFALHRLKTKFLILKRFIEKFTDYQSELKLFYENYPISIEPSENISFLSTLYKYYIYQNTNNLQMMLPKEHVSERVRDLMENRDNKMTNDKLLEMATYTFHSEEDNIIKFIMRDIKASLFVCNIMFAKIDVKHPFLRGTDIQIDEEEFMISQDFVPELFLTMHKFVESMDYKILYDILDAFGFMMARVLDGINYAYEEISRNQIKLELDETLYTTRLD